MEKISTIKFKQNHLKAVYFKMKNFLYFLVYLSIGGMTLAQNPDSTVENYVYYHLRHNNPQASLNFLKTLETMNHPEGLFILGLFYLSGYGVKKDLILANFYFFRSGCLGFAPAFKALGDSYLSGDGIKKCPELALYYYECSARRGYGPGQFNAGALLKDGQDCLAPNPQQAYYWLDKAAHNHDLGELAQDAAALRDKIFVNK